MVGYFFSREGTSDRSCEIICPFRRCHHALWPSAQNDFFFFPFVTVCLNVGQGCSQFRDCVTTAGDHKSTVWVENHGDANASHLIVESKASVEEVSSSLQEHTHAAPHGVEMPRTGNRDNCSRAKRWLLGYPQDDLLLAQLLRCGHAAVPEWWAIFLANLLLSCPVHILN